MSASNQHIYRGLDQILEALFKPYKERVPDVAKIIQAMLHEGLIESESEIVNDHIAFRTLGVPNLGLASFEKIFLHYGYQKRSPYFFEKKKLDAFWYEPPVSHYPRIFLSELKVEHLSEEAQSIIHRFTRDIKSDPVDALDIDNAKEVGLFFHTPLWDPPSVEEYQTLLEESEYAAWVIYNRYYLNHFTISVHDLPEPYNQLEGFNDFLEAKGIILNTAGGKIKASADGLLRQSSTVAKMIEAEFADGKAMTIAGSYVEFAERSVLPEFQALPQNKITNEHRRNGFESANADKIFESTYLDQTRPNQN